MAERKRKGGLGRGLDSLIPAGDPSSSGFLEIPLDHINPNPSQPRTRFDEDALESLSASIKEVGVLQPVVVRASDGGYELVAGERRWRAARLAGLSSIPAVVREPDEEGWSRLTEALIENVQREDLGPLEEAAAYRQLMEDFGWTHEEVGQHVAKSRSTITNQIRLLQLPAGIQGLLERGELTAGHAKALVGMEDEAYANHIAQRAAKEGWSVRMVEDAVRARAGDPAQPRTKPTRAPAPHAEELAALEGRLSERLAAPVDISMRGKNGKLTVKFESLDELERIYRTMFGS
jgi:ParB family chromosome partitioning protein